MLTLLRPLSLLLAAPVWAQNPLYVSSGSAPGEWLGWGLVPHADVDGDGLRENLAFRARGAALLRGSDGAVLREYQRGLLALGDLDGDGWSELAAVGPDSETYFPHTESIDVISGFSGAVLANWSWNPLGPAPSELRRTEPLRLGDVNGDGRGDVLAMEWPWGQSGAYDTAALVLSGVDGSELRRHTGPLGALPMGDLNGDGRADYFLEQSASTPVVPPRLISGASGTVLAVHSPVPPHGDLHWMSDLDGDGVREIVRQYNGPEFRIHSGANGALLHVFQGFAVRSERWHSPVEMLAADVDGDGVSEVGVYESFSHSTLLVSQASGAVIARYNVLSSVLNAGDVDGDGKEDLLFGSPLSAEGRGRALLATAPYDARVGVGFAYGSNACPCGPGANPLAGCAGAVASGAALTAWGSSSIAARDLQFYPRDFSGESGVFATAFLVYSPNVLATPIPSGAGLLALAPPRQRIARIRFFHGTVLDAPALNAWSSFSAGQVGYFQAWSREFPQPNDPCQFTHNLSNALAITFTP